MPHDVGPLVTGLAAADALGAGLVCILLSGKARHARRVRRAEERVAEEATRALKAAEMERVLERQRLAVQQAVRAMNEEITRNMFAQTEYIERVQTAAWPVNDRDLPMPVRVPVMRDEPMPARIAAMTPRPYLEKPYPVT